VALDVELRDERLARQIDAGLAGEQRRRIARRLTQCS
jgi:hypothetical protein